MRNLEKNCLGRSDVFKFPFSEKTALAQKSGEPLKVFCSVVQDVYKGVVEEQKVNKVVDVDKSEVEGVVKTQVDAELAPLTSVSSPSSSSSPQVPSGSVDVKGFLSGFAGGKASMEKSVEGFMKADDDLVMKTEVNDPVALSLWELLGEDAKNEGYYDLAKTFSRYGYWFKGHMVSYQRGGRREFKEIATADAEAQRAEGMGPLEKGGLEKRRR